MFGGQKKDFPVEIFRGNSTFNEEMVMKEEGMVQWRKGWGPQGGSPFIGNDLVGGWAAALSRLSLAAVSKHSPQLPSSGTVPLKPLHSLLHLWLGSVISQVGPEARLSWQVL